MNRSAFAVIGILLATQSGCLQSPPTPAGRADRGEPVERTSRYERPREEGRQAEISHQTERDRRFGEFVAQTAGDMVQKLAVGLERSGTLRVQLGKSTSPEDTLPLTKSLMAGARKDFPDKAITLSVFDPEGEPILKAYYRPDQGVRYEIVGNTADAGNSKSKSAGETPAAVGVDESGTTQKDRRFAEWAKDKGRPFLRYVQADLERNGRLWFGITRDVLPKDVPDLTKSLLQGARTEFPRKELTATVFDPEGERIGRARLDLNGKVSWTE